MALAIFAIEDAEMRKNRPQNAHLQRDALSEWFHLANTERLRPFHDHHPQHSFLPERDSHLLHPVVGMLRAFPNIVQSMEENSAGSEKANC